MHYILNETKQKDEAEEMGRPYQPTLGLVACAAVFIFSLRLMGAVEGFRCHSSNIDVHFRKTSVKSGLEMGKSGRALKDDEERGVWSKAWLRA